MDFGGVLEFFFIEVEDEDFVALLEEMTSETSTNALGGYVQGDIKSVSITS